MVRLDAALLLLILTLLPLVALLVLITRAFHRVARNHGFIPPDKSSWTERRAVSWPSAGLLVLYVMAFAYGIFVEVDWVRLTWREIRVDRPILGHDRFRIVHLSDLHLEAIGRREERMMDLIREADPHIILLTGDYLNTRAAEGALREVLGALRAPYGVYAVEGDMDAKFRVRDAFEAAGVPLLLDETRLIGGKLRLVGRRASPHVPLKELLEHVEGEAYTIYLHHRPEEVEALKDCPPGRPVNLFLCGHTHGGQVRLPFWGGVLGPPERHEGGLYDAGGTTMVVNRGIGTTGIPMRLLCRPEVAVLELVFEKK